MAGGILFPDIAGALSSGASAGAASAQGQYMMKDRAARDEIAPLIPKALQGDSGALDQIGAKHPDTFLKLVPMLDRIDANKRAKIKETSEWTTRAAMGVLSLPEAERPAAYQAALADGQRLGYQIDMPPQYDRAVEGRLKHILNQTRPFADYWKSQGEGPQAMPAPGGGPAPGDDPQGSVIDRSRAAAASIESGAKGYSAVGPVVNSKGNRAYGAHQVMDFNIGPWTQEVLGRAMTPQEFLNDPKAQDAVYNAKMGQYIKKYGSPEAASRAWFAGEGGMNNLNATDVLGTTVQSYGQKFAQAYGQGATGPGPQVAQGDNTRADASGTPLPPAQQVPGAPDGMDVDNLRRQLIASGGDLFTDPKTKQLEIQNGNYVVRSLQNPRQIVRLIPAPKPKEQADKGLFGDSLTGRALTVLRTADPTSQDYAMAYALMSKPQVIPDGAGGQTVVQPMDLSMFPRPGFGGAAPAPAPGGAAPGGPSPTQVGGVTVQNIPGKGKALDNSIRDELKKISDTALELPQLVKSFDPSFGGFVLESKGDVDNWMKRNLPDGWGGSDPKGQAQWWQRYDQFANLERNKLFGSALTPGETAAFKAAMVNPGMKPDQIKANLERQSEIAQKALSRIANSAAASGYNREAIEVLTGTSFSAMPDPMGAVPQAAPQGAPAPKTQAKGQDRGTYTGPNNSPVSWAEIEATARNRGISTDEVIGTLGLKPTGMQ